MKREMADEVVPRREDERGTEGEDEPDPAHVLWAVSLACQQEAAADDEERAREHTRHDRLVEEDERDGNGEQRRHADRDGRPRRSRLADAEREERLREAWPEDAREGERP